MLQDANSRLLSFELTEPPRKIAKPQVPNLYRATFYDYTNNRTISVDGRLDDSTRVAVNPLTTQPVPTHEEFEAAFELVTEDAELGPAIREHFLVPYEPMPAVVLVEQPDGTVERTIAVGLLPAREGRRVRHEIVGVNMVRRRVDRYEGGAPPTSQANAMPPLPPGHVEARWPR